MIILAGKILLLSVHGSAVPFWDQWDDEAERTYRNYLESTFGLEQLFFGHNEHRLVLTRLLNLALLEIGGRWDPLLQMLVNALLHCAALAAFGAMLLPGLPPRLAMVFMAAVTFVFLIPFDWENTLWGFQSQVYFLLLFSFLSIRHLTGAEAWSGRYWRGLGYGVLAFLGMAGGAFALFAGAAVRAAQMLLGIRHGRTEAGGVLLCLTLAFLLVGWVPEAPGHRALRAQGPGEFLGLVVRIMGWPLETPGLGLLLVHAPAMILLRRLWRDRSGPLDIRWRVLGLLLWVTLLQVGVALTRAHSDPLQSRYLDIFALAPLCNLWIALHLVAGRNLPHLRWAVLAWMVVLAAGFGELIRPALCQVEVRQAEGVAHGQVVTAFLRTGDPAVFAGKTGPRDLPHPLPAVLADRLSQPTILRVLPRELLPQGTPTPRVSRLLHGSAWTRLTRWVRRTLLGLPPLLLALAIGIFAAPMLLARDLPHR